MGSRPVIFISAVSQELKSVRDLVAKTLQQLGYEPKWQDIAPTETGDLRSVLRKWVEDSAAVIQLVGQRYGCAPPVADQQFGRCSYTQFEARYARHRGRKVWYLLLDPAHPTDPVAPEPAPLPDLQSAYRQHLQSGNHLYHRSASLNQTQLLVLQLRDDLSRLRRRGKQWAALVLAFLVLIVLGLWFVKKNTDQMPQIVLGQQQAAEKQTELSGQLTQVQEALSRIQQNTDPKNDPISQWPQDRLETELARQMEIEVKDLRAILTAGKTSLDALLQGQALLASGQTKEAGEKFDLVIHQEKDALQRLRQAYEGKAQIAFGSARDLEALAFQEKAAALVDKTIDPMDWAAAQTLVTVIELNLARYKEAEPIMKEIVRLREEQLGQKHPDLAIALNNLASLYEATNRLAEAERMMARALKINEESFGPAHPNVVIVLNNLARIYQATSRFSEAESLLKKALEISEKNLTQSSLLVAVCLNNLARLYRTTGRFAEAEPLMQRALKIDEKSLGPAHPRVASDLNILAQVYQTMNKLDEAEPLLVRALEIEEDIYGPEHPDFAAALNNLAGLYQETDRLADAELLMERSLKIVEQRLGPDHPNVGTALNNLARIYQETSRVKEAEPLMRRHLVLFLKFARTTGYLHPNSNTALNNYLSILNELKVSPAEIAERIASIGKEAGFPATEYSVILKDLGKGGKDGGAKGE